MSPRVSQRATLQSISLLLVTHLVAACGSGSAGGAGNPGLTATFTSIQDNVFTPVCTACHAGANAPQGLRLDAGNSYGLLVGVASAEQPSVLRVAPGDPNGSYLIQKLEGTAAVGGRMPLNRAPLPQSDIDVIRQWITDGAQPSTAPLSSGPIRVTSLSPLPDSSLPAVPTSITAMFDRELDASTVNATTFLVDRSGGDGSFAEGNEVAVAAVSITVPMSNPSSAVFDMTGAQPVEDTYRVRLSGSAAANIQDQASNALDGEFSGTFPSGNATAGGDFVAHFVVASTQPTLTSIQTNVFTPRCAGCHSGPSSGALPAGMDLTSASASFAGLVGVASVQVPSLQRVRVGDPANSYLIQKLEGTAAVGERMPRGQAPLNQATIAAVRQWVADGANP